MRLYQLKKSTNWKNYNHSQKLYSFTKSFNLTTYLSTQSHVRPTKLYQQKYSKCQPYQYCETTTLTSKPHTDSYRLVRLYRTVYQNFLSYQYRTSKPDLDSSENQSKTTTYIKVSLIWTPLIKVALTEYRIESSKCPRVIANKNHFTT